MNGRVILVTASGAASGSKAAAAALVCAGSEPDRPGLLIDLGGRPPRPTLIASSGARKLEERLAVHLSAVPAASRGQTCHLALPDDSGAVERLRAVLPLVRDSVAVLHIAPGSFRGILGAPGIVPTGVLLCADLGGTGASLVALAVPDLLARDLRVRVLKRPLTWIVARRALFGILPAESPGGLPSRLRGALLESQISAAHACYAKPGDAKIDTAGTAKQERGDHARIGQRRGLHRYSERKASR